MAHDEELADRLRLLLTAEHPSEKRMFGGLAFLVGGHMAVAVSGEGGLMVRVEPVDLEALLREPGAGPMEMKGRALKGWLRVDGSALDDDAVLEAWARRGVSYVRSLPPK